HRRNPAACGSERALPQLLPGLGIIDVKLVIASGNEDQPGDSWNDAELEIARSAGSRDAKARQPRIISERNLPFDRALVQVVRRQRRVGWPDDIRVQAVAVHRVPFSRSFHAIWVRLRSEP